MLLVAAAGALPRADRDLRLELLVAFFLRVAGGVEEAREAFDLIGLQHLHAGRRRDHQHERDRRRAQRQQARQMAPGDAGDEQQRHRDREVDETGAEIRLGDHEHRRQQRRQHHPRRGLPFPQLARAVDHERREREDQEDLAELRALEGEQREAYRPHRALGRAPGAQHHQDAQHQRRVDRDFVVAQARVVDPRQRHHRRQADQQVDDLALGVVARLAGHSLGGDPAQHDDRADP